MRLIAGVLGIVAGLYDVIVVATDVAPLDVLVAAPAVLFLGVKLTWSAMTDASGGAW